MIAIAFAVAVAAQPVGQEDTFSGGPFGSDVFGSVTGDVFGGGSGGGPPPPMFDYNPDAFGSGPSLVSSTLVVNGTTMTLVADFDARNISGDTWTGSVFNLSKAEDGANVAPDQRTPFTEVASEAVTYTDGDWHEAGNTTAGNVGTNDFVIEWVDRPGSVASTEAVLGKADLIGGGAGVEKGFAINHANASGAVQFRVADASAVCTGGAAFTNGVGVHGYHLAFFDRSGNIRHYLNGQNPTNVVSIAGCAGSLDESGEPFSIGAYDGNAVDSNNTITFARVWTCAGCLNTTAEMDTIAAERMARLEGTYAQRAGGQPYMSIHTRGVTKTCDLDHYGDGVRRLFTVSRDWMCVGRRKELAGGEYAEGLFAEASMTNKLLRSAEMDNASWTKTQCAATADTTADVLDDGLTEGDTLESTDGAGSVAHFARQNATVTAATHVFSCWVKAGADSATHAWLRDNTVANAIAWYNLSTCAAATAGAGTSRTQSEAWGDGWCRAQFTFTGTAAAHDFDVGYSNADNVTAYDDGTDSTSDLIVWGCQVEAPEAHMFASSYVATTTATVTRNRDNVSWAHSGNAPASGPATVESSFLTVSHTGTGQPLAFGSGASFNQVSQRCNNATNEHAGLDGASTQWQIGSAGGCNDGEIITLRTVIRGVNNVQAYKNGVSAGTDTSNVDVLATITVGASAIGPCRPATGCTEAQPNTLVTRTRIWASAVNP